MHPYDAGRVATPKPAGSARGHTGAQPGAMSVSPPPGGEVRVTRSAEGSRGLLAMASNWLRLWLGCLEFLG